MLWFVVCLFLISFNWIKRPPQVFFRDNSYVVASAKAKGEPSKKETGLKTASSIKYTSVAEPDLERKLDWDDFYERLTTESSKRESSNGRADNQLALNRDQTEQLLCDSVEIFHSKNFIKPPNERCEKRLPKAILIGV